MKKNLKEENKKSQARKDKLKEACEVEERRERVENVSKILEAVKYKTESDRNEAILSFSKATNLSLEEISKLVEPLKSDYLSAQIYKKGLY